MDVNKKIAISNEKILVVEEWKEGLIDKNADLFLNLAFATVDKFELYGVDKF